MQRAHRCGGRADAPRSRTLAWLATIALVSLAGPVAAEPPVETIAGHVVFSQEVTHNRFDEFTQFFDWYGNPSGTDDRFSDTTVTITQQDDLRCVRWQESYKTSANEPVRTSDDEFCTSTSPSVFRLGMQVFTGTVRTTSERPVGVVSEIADETKTGSSTVTLTIGFPDLPAGAEIREVRVRPVGDANLTRPTTWMFPGSSLVELGPPTYDPIFIANCPDGFISRNLAWVFPGDVVDENGQMQVSFSVDPSCVRDETVVSRYLNLIRNTIEWNQSNGSLVGFFTAEADIAPAERFDVKFATFIPGDSVQGPPHAFCRADGDLLPQILRFGADNRTQCDPSPTASFRTRQVLSVVADGSVAEIDGEVVTPEGLVAGSAAPAVGVTKSYARPAFDDGIIDARDDDGILDDCVSLHQMKRAATDGMLTIVRRRSDSSVEIHVLGSADNPLVASASIDWDLTLTIDVAGGEPHWTLEGTHNNFPAYEIFVNGQKVHGHSPGSPPFGVMDLVTLFDNPFTDVSVSASGTLQ